MAEPFDQRVGLILDKYDAMALAAQQNAAPDEPGPQMSDLIPPVAAGLSQVAVQAIPQLRALGLPARGAMTLLSGAGGAAGGEALRQQVAEEPYDPDKVAQAGIENALYDMGGNVVFRYGGKLIKIPYQYVRKLLNKNYGEALSGEADEAAVAAQKWLQERDAKASLTAYQAAGKTSDALKEGIARASILSGSVVRDLDQAQINVIAEEVNRLTSNATNITREEFGEQFAAVMNAGEEALKKWAGPRYEAIDNLGYGLKVDLTKVKKDAAEKLKKFREIAAVPEKRAFIQQQILGIQGNSLTFAQTRAKLSDLKSLQRSMEKKDPRYEVIKEAIDELENAMEISAARGGTDVFKFYRQVNDDFSKTAQALRSDVILDAMAKNPERMGEYFFRSGNVTEIKKTYEALADIAKNNKDLTEDVGRMVTNFQESYLKSIFGSIKDEASLKSALDMLKDPKNRETLDTILGGAKNFKGVEPKWRQVNALINAMEFSAKRPKSMMSLFIASKEAGPIGQLVSGTVSVAASVIAALPTILARTASDPKAVNELLKINRSSIKVGFTDQLASKVVQIAERAGIDMSPFTGTTEPQQPTQAPQGTPPAQTPTTGAPTGSQATNIDDILQELRGQ